MRQALSRTVTATLDQAIDRKHAWDAGAACAAYLMSSGVRDRKEHNAWMLDRGFTRPWSGRAFRLLAVLAPMLSSGLVSGAGKVLEAMLA